MAKSNSQVSTIDDEDTAVAVAEAVPVKTIGAGHDAQLSGAKRVITIHATDSEGGGDVVSLGLNGVAYQIPRNTSCEIPVELFEVIKNARTVRMVQKPHGGIEERIAQRFSYSAE